ncbi:MAG: phenylalanine--tRNA ligase subunit beta [Candidatus Zixiibacteriota bacterium]|nr:MAG: phenylalanine--tRNA ligase subunit beta [candidate division Zixibacteria bacterium]
MISYKWLKELTGLDWSPQEMAERLTLCGTACEYIDKADRYMDRVVVGKVTALKPVEGAAKIQLATVDLGGDGMDVICGAPNVAVGQKVPVALEGAKLAGDMVIKKVKIRGVESAAMICSERELGISDDHSGIMVLEADAVLGTPLAEQLQYDDYILTFELTPNRGDSMSAIGVARDLAALGGTEVRRPSFELKEVSAKASDSIKVSIDDPEGCPRYAARLIRNVKIGPSPWWLKRKLLTSGVRPISNVVDITNLVMLETGHPLHAFDLDRFGSREVVVRRAADGEEFVTLDGERHELVPDVLLITNGKVGVAAGGIMGGLDSEIEDTTTDILLEAAYFDPAVIRKGRKHLGLVTESSSRFERGADPNGIPYAIDRAAHLMQELCGGEVLKGIVDCYPGAIEPKEITLRPSRCNSVLGTSIAVSRMKEILQGLEFTVTGDDPMKVTVPTFRPDIEREIDLIEEVARIEGYDNIPDAVANIGPLYTPLGRLDRFKADARHILTGSGFDEIVNHGLVHQNQSSLVNPGQPQVKLTNPASEELNTMRNSLVTTTLNVISHNLAHRNLDLCLFELGKVYFPGGGPGQWVEKERLVLAVTGHSPHTWRSRPRPYDFYDVSGAVDHLARHFNWSGLTYRPHRFSAFEGDLSFQMTVDNIEMGFLGKVSAKISEAFEIKQPVYLAEVELEPLLAAEEVRKEYRPLPVYPAAPRDLALVVDQSVKAGDLVEVVKESAGDLAESVEIFDLYTGKQIDKGKKSIAISINYRSDEGSLSSEQVDQMQKALVSRLKKNFNAQIRDK